MIKLFTRLPSSTVATNVTCQKHVSADVHHMFTACVPVPAMLHMCKSNNLNLAKPCIYIVYTQCIEDTVLHIQSLRRYLMSFPQIMWNSQDWGSRSWFLRKFLPICTRWFLKRSVPNFETYPHTKSHSVGFYVIPSGQKTQKTGLEPKNWSLGGEIPCRNRLFRLHLTCDQTSIGFHWVSTHQHHQACRSPKKKNSADLVCALMPISNCKNQLTHHLSP